jgi:hypothetical protein
MNRKKKINISGLISKRISSKSKLQPSLKQDKKTHSIENIPRPAGNKQVKSLINYYHLAQYGIKEPDAYAEKAKKAKKKDSKKKKEKWKSWNSKLKSIRKVANKEDPQTQFVCFYWKKGSSKIGHAVLVLGMHENKGAYYSEKWRYLKIYDPNLCYTKPAISVILIDNKKTRAVYKYYRWELEGKPIYEQKEIAGISKTTNVDYFSKLKVGG